MPRPKLIGAETRISEYRVPRQEIRFDNTDAATSDNGCRDQS